MYRKNGHLACKNRANGRGGSVGLGVGFAVHCKTAKNSIKCLIFKGLLFFGIFSVASRWLFGVHQLPDFQRFANITQMLDFQCFYASLGVGRVGQG